MNEQGDAGGDDRTRLARPDSQSANGDREKLVPVQLATSRIDCQRNPVDSYSAVSDYHT